MARPIFPSAFAHLCQVSLADTSRRSRCEHNRCSDHQGRCDDFLALVPEKWVPVFRKGYAQTQESRALARTLKRATLRRLSGTCSR